MSDQPSLDDIKIRLEDNGYVVLKAASYRRAQERQRIAQVRMEDAFKRCEDIDRWAQEGYAELQRLRDRLTFVYGVARAHGATVEELSGP